MAAGLRLSGLGSAYGIDELADFVLNAGPTTSVFHQLTEGYGVGERLSARRLDALNMLVWAKTEDARKPVAQQKHRPKQTWVPGMEEEVEPEKEYEVMTIEDYLQRTGLA